MLDGALVPKVDVDFKAAPTVVSATIDPSVCPSAAARACRIMSLPEGTVADGAQRVFARTPLGTNMRMVVRRLGRVVLNVLREGYGLPF